MNKDESKSQGYKIAEELSAGAKNNIDTLPISKISGITATAYDSGFPLSHDTYNGIYAASDGLIYYALCSESIDEGGKMYSFNPDTKQIILCGDLTEACGEKGLNAIPQGKNHVNFVETDGKLFFGTHIGYYNNETGIDKIGTPPEGYDIYPGGHLLSYDLKTKQFEDLGIVPQQEGVLSMNMDIQRRLIYGITWPRGYFFRYSMEKKEMENLGTISGKGEDGTGEEYRTLCRSIAINPEDGSAYYSTSEGDIFRCAWNKDEIELIEGDSLKKDYFGYYDPSSPGHMGYNWRQVFWHRKSKSIYGVHGNSGYFFRFDPQLNKVEVLDRITSKPSQRSGMFDQFSYGYLGLILGSNERTVYYLTGSPMYINGKRVIGKSTTGKGEARGLENLHLITYDIPTCKYQDHGPIYFEDGQVPMYVNSIAIGLDGTIYFLGRITENGKTRTDLISIPNPL
jgi:hypothetical protein